LSAKIKPINHRTSISLLVGVILVFLLSACAVLQETGLSFPWDVQPTLTPTRGPILATMPTFSASNPEKTPASTTPESTSILTIWFPPEMDPKSDSLAAKLLLDKLEEFAKANDLQLQTRPKAAKGSGGLLDSLAAAKAAAPDALPDLVILDQDDLALAASKGYISPLPMEGFLRDEKDWFEAARAMTTFEGQSYGAPISLDPFVFGMTGVSSVNNSVGWAAIRTSLGKVAFAADDPRGIFLMTMYIAEGGNVQDSLNHPVLDQEPLARTMIYLHQAYMDRHISTISTQAQTEAQVVDALLNGNTDIGFIKLSQLLKINLEKTSRLPLRISLPGQTLAQGKFWAISTPNPEKLAKIQALILAVSEPEFMGNYTKALGMLPARPSALKLWADLTTEVPWTRIGEMSLPMPEESIINRLGPILRKATLDDLQEAGDPAQITSRTLESVK
jgi:hypothetical protein